MDQQLELKKGSSKNQSAVQARPWPNKGFFKIKSPFLK
jgi:hypothetical protein